MIIELRNLVDLKDNALLFMKTTVFTEFSKQPLNITTCIKYCPLQTPQIRALSKFSWKKVTLVFGVCGKLYLTFLEGHNS